jgi:hypothetical protein
MTRTRAEYGEIEDASAGQQSGKYWILRVGSRRIEASHKICGRDGTRHTGEREDENEIRAGRRARKMVFPKAVQARGIRKGLRSTVKEARRGNR